jgi:hypothetical protein
MQKRQKPALKLFISLLAGLALASPSKAAPTGYSSAAQATLIGGSGSGMVWPAPSVAASYKALVFVPPKAAITNALYRVYPKGGSTATCSSASTTAPCYEVTIDQTKHQNAWVQLMLNNSTNTQWPFTSAGFITAVTSNLPAADALNISTQLVYQNPLIAIGKTYQGGIVFYIDSTGLHGLAAAPTDQSANTQWHNGTLVQTKATGLSIGTGKANTQTIITAQGAGTYAAKIAASATIGGYTGWFLPSRDELQLMHDVIGPGAKAPLTNVGKFAFDDYWSSSEDTFDVYTVWVVRFVATNGIQLPSYEGTHSHPVRAIRAF